MSDLKSSASAIIVKDVPRGVSEEILSQYFFSRGGEIKQLTFCGERREATIEFEDSSGMCYSSGVIRTVNMCTT